ncbi:MAG: hypothetical protein JSW60_05175 [Thermoplasmatales archaeon]|nr:MAG: hypothetical protein JSW60_05175 [Thermoplasmatales archaeon]
MKSKLVGILICMMILTTVPIAAGLDNKIESSGKTTGIYDRTMIRGIVLFPRRSQDGKTINFFALRLNFKTINCEGMIWRVVRLRRVQIPSNFKGYLGRYYIHGLFRGSLHL